MLLLFEKIYIIFSFVEYSLLYFYFYKLQTFMPAQKRKNKQKNSENKKSKQQKNNVKEFFKEPVSIIDMMKGKTVQGDRANISDVLAFVFICFTSFLLL